MNDDNRDELARLLRQQIGETRKHRTGFSPWNVIGMLILLAILGILILANIAKWSSV